MSSIPKTVPAVYARTASQARIVAEYDYKDERGDPLYQTVRIEPKDFRQRRRVGDEWVWDLTGVRRVPYRLDELHAASGALVFVTEGEKDADALAERGLLATTCPMGAGKWLRLDRRTVNAAFRMRPVVILPDNDEPGRAHAMQVAADLYPLATSVKVLELSDLPPKGDVSDWLSAGGTAGVLQKLADAASPWRPPADRSDEADRRTAACGSAPPVAVVLTAADLPTLMVEWIWRARMPRGAVTLLDGDPGLGKSTITCDLAARVSRGWVMPPAPGGEVVTKPAGVLMVSAEDDLSRTIRPRLVAAGANLHQIHFFDSVDTVGGRRPPALPADHAIIERLAREYSVDLIVIDPLMAYLDRSVDAHKDADVRRVLHLLKIMAEGTGAAVLVLRHLNKFTAGPAIYRGGGSIGIIGAARSALVVGRDPGDPFRCILAPTKCNLCAHPPALVYSHEPVGDVSRIAWGEEVDLAAEDILVQSRPGRQTKLDRCCSTMRDLLSRGPVETNELTEVLGGMGYSKRTVDRARAQLNVRSERVGYGADGRWMMSLPGSAAAGDEIPD